MQQLQQLDANKFISGVIEGFYGRPWGIDQRRKLFKRLKEFGMNTYLYAPKDDSKHRAYWRELYSVEEGEALRVLIESATENNINFIYAISPGLDVTYSSEKEQQILKRKLNQVKEFGCKYFSILFDDIDSVMQQSDKTKFNSFAEAQSYLTNELYLYLNEPEQFYFCPTEYCDVFSKPNVDQSEYLKTIGEKLLPNIRIMWTGPGIVSEYITIEHIKKISTILKRKPLIWDNFHANDYDLNCIFLGPFTSRSPNLCRYISGILTNPNCEFECNYIPIYTLSLWSHSYIDDINDSFDEYNNSISVKVHKSLLNETNIDVDMLTRNEFILNDYDDVKIDDNLLEIIDFYLNHYEINNELIDFNKFYYDSNKIMTLAIKKWLPILNEKQEQIIVYKLPILVDESVSVLNTNVQSNVVETSALSAFNSTTKQKAQLDACNSLVVNHHLHHHHQIDPIAEIEAITSIIDQQQPQGEQNNQQQHTQGEVVIINNIDNDDILLIDSQQEETHEPYDQQVTITSLSKINNNNNHKKNKKKLKKFLFNNKFDNNLKRRKRERVDGGELYKHRSSTSNSKAGVKKNKSNKRILTKFKKKKLLSLINKVTPLPSTNSYNPRVNSIDNNNNNNNDNNNDDDDDDDTMDAQMDLTRPNSSVFLSPIGHTMQIDDTSNIDICASTMSVINNQNNNNNNYIENTTSLPVTNITISSTSIANDIELLSIPPMSLPPSTRTSSVASYKSSSSSSLLSITRKKSPKKRKKYEPLIALSSSSKLNFKARKKKFKKNNNNKIFIKNNKCTSPMDLGMLSDAAVTIGGGGGGNSSVRSTTVNQINNSVQNFTESDLKILIDLYYLPFEYGKFAIYLLKEFKWLKLNAIRLNIVLNYSNQNKINEWMKRCERYLNVIDRIDLIQTKLTKILNKQLFIEIDTRLNEFNSFLQIIRLFICWLQQNCFISNENKHEFCLNLNQFYRRENDRLEPWDLRGGIINELKRISYFTSFNDLFHISFPIQIKINTNMFQLRNYRSNDYEQIKNLFSFNNNHDTNELNYDLFAIDVFLEYSNEYCFLIENKYTQKISGILLASLNVKYLNEIYKHKFLTKLCEKYPKRVDNESIVNYENLIMNFHNSISPFKILTNESYIDDYPSICILKINTNDINNELELTYLVRQLLGNLLLCLKSQGSNGVHAQILSLNKDEELIIKKIFEKFNFKNINSIDTDINNQNMESIVENDNFKILGRKIRIKIKPQLQQIN